MGCKQVWAIKVSHAPPPRNARCSQYPIYPSGVLHQILAKGLSEWYIYGQGGDSGLATRLRKFAFLVIDWGRVRNSFRTEDFVIEQGA